MFSWISRLKRENVRVEFLGDFPFPNEFIISDFFDGIGINLSIGGFLSSALHIYLHLIDRDSPSQVHRLSMHWLDRVRELVALHTCNVLHRRNNNYAQTIPPGRKGFALTRDDLEDLDVGARPRLWVKSLGKYLRRTC